MNLSELHFPVFYIGKQPNIEGNISFFITRKKMIESDIDYIKVIDDKSVLGNTLAERRLALASQGVALYKLKYAIYFLQDMIKITKGETWFIDSAGNLFKYKKSKSCRLVFKKVLKTLNHSGVFVLEVEGIPTRYKTLYPASPDQTWAGILYTPDGPLLYGLYNKYYEDTRRFI
jgi:hypothetical protein